MTYDNHKRIIHKLAGGWANSTGIDKSEFLSAANEEFVLTTRKFDPDRGVKFSTFLYDRLNYCFRSLTIRLYNRNEIERTGDVGPDTFSRDHDPETALIFKQWILALSKESQFILETIWNTPADIVQWATEESYAPKTTVRLIHRYLRKLGWEWEVIWSCVSEIRAEIKNL